MCVGGFIMKAISFFFFSVFSHSLWIPSFSAERGALRMNPLKGEELMKSPKKRIRKE